MSTEVIFEPLELAITIFKLFYMASYKRFFRGSFEVTFEFVRGASENSQEYPFFLLDTCPGSEGHGALGRSNIGNAAYVLCYLIPPPLPSTVIIL